MYDSNYMTLWKKKSYRKMKSPVVSMGLEEVGRAALGQNKGLFRIVKLFCVTVMVNRWHHAFVKAHISL